jgi:cyclin B
MRLVFLELTLSKKFKEQNHVLVGDLEVLCCHQYTRSHFFAMERNILQAVGCDLGFPLSYSFLRRFAQVTNIGTYLLTLARFILEISLHYYSNVLEFPSKLAAAAFVLALCVKEPKERGWVSWAYFDTILINLDFCF